MRSIIAAALLVAMAGPSGAVDVERIEKLYALGQVLAAETPCAMRYNAAAVRHWIARNVDASDMEFASDLETRRYLHADRIRTITGSARIAMCTQTRRVAKHYGFVD